MSIFHVHVCEHLRKTVSNLGEKRRLRMNPLEGDKIKSCIILNYFICPCSNGLVTPLNDLKCSKRTPL